MAGPRFSDLQRQGTPVRFDDLVRDGGEVHEAPSGVESFARGAYQGAGMGFADEQAGALDAIGGHLKRTFTNDWKRTGGGWWDDIKAEAQQVADDYRQGRDESRRAYSEAAEANPATYGMGQFGGAVATGLLTGGASALGRAGVKGALTAGALEGAAGGLGGSNADLTHADLDAYAKAFRDSTEGGITGAGLGAGIYGIGKGLKWAGGKALSGLRRARGELEAGVSAEREAADATARAADDEAAGRLAKDEYAARETNRRMDERAAREEAKRAAKEARDAARARAQQQKDFRAASEPTRIDKRYADPNVIPIRRGAPAPQAAPEVLGEPGTKTLAGYEGGANRRWVDNDFKVQAFRKELEDPSINPARRARLERYVSGHGDAVDNPGAFQRRIMAEEMRKAGYPREVIERVMADRVGSNGEILPRGSSPEPVTQPMDLGDAFRQGRGPKVAGQGGGGSAWDNAPPDQKTWVNRRLPEMADPYMPKSGDPFHDAKTKVALHETTPDISHLYDELDHLENSGNIDAFEELAGELEEIASKRTFEFKDPKSGRIIEIEARENSNGDVWVEGIGHKDRNAAHFVDQWDEEANKIGPRALKEVLPDIAKAFPDARMIGGRRVTGTRRGKNFDRPARPTWAPLPEVTQQMDASDLRTIAAKSESPALLRQREKGFGSQNMGAARYGDETIAYPNRDILRSQEAIGDATQAGREPPVSMEDLRQWTGTPEAPRTPEGLPPLEDITQPGAPSFPSDVRRAQPFQERPQLRPEYQPRPTDPRPVFDEALAERRAMGANAQMGGRLPPEAPTPAMGRPARQPEPAYDQNNSMVSPRDFDAETVVPVGDTQVPRAPRPAPYAGPAAPELSPEPMQVNPLRQAQPRPLAPPVAPPSQTVMGAPPGSLVRQARPSVQELASQRESGALGDLARAGWEGARDANNALAAPFGAAYGIGKEALKNPAVRARAITLFRLDRLARVRPEVWARVGPTLQRAFQAGPERYKAERHVLLLRDPEFRAAEADADAELERMDGQPPTRRAAAGR